MSRMRNSDLRLAEFNYETLKVNPHICVYCGMPANTMDHLMPLSLMANLSDLNLNLKSIKVPACMECNNLAGTVFFTSFQDKKKFIRYKISQKYAKTLAMPEWDKWELEEMGPNARQDIEMFLLKKKIILERLKYESLAEIIMQEELLPVKIRNNKLFESTNNKMFYMQSLIAVNECTKTIGEWCLKQNISISKLKKDLQEGYSLCEIFSFFIKKRLNTTAYSNICLAIERNDLILAIK